MNVDTMLEQLADRLEDVGNIRIDADIKIDFLQNAQLELAGLIDNDYLTEIESSKSVTATGGVVAMTAAVLDSAVLKGRYGVLGVTFSTNDKYVDIKKQSEIKRRTGGFFAANTQDPYAYVFQNKVYCVNGETNPAVTIHFLTFPTALIAGGDCDLNETLHSIIIDLAEASCWRMDRELERAAAAGSAAIEKINAFNASGKG